MLRRLLDALRMTPTPARSAGTPSTPVGSVSSSGELHFDGEQINYTSQHYGAFKVRLADMIAIAEYTTDEGPFIDDWFLVFVTRQGEWRAASMYADGHQTCMDAIGVVLGQPLCAALFASASNASNILWPPDLANRSLFTTNDETAVIVPELQARFEAGDVSRHGR